MLAATAGVLLSGCSSSPQATSSTPAVNSSATVIASAITDSGDCLLSVVGSDVEVGIARPTSSCSSWMKKLAGSGLAWYPINQLVKLGSRDIADTDTMAETCDLTDGMQELFVEDGGEMPTAPAPAPGKSKTAENPKPRQWPRSRAQTGANLS